MTTTEQAFEIGFLKRAAEHGLDEAQAQELLKEAGVSPALLEKYINATNRGLRGRSTLIGGAGGGVLGGAIGGVNGLLSDSENPEDGLIARLGRGLSGAARGAAVGGAVGAGAGLAAGQAQRVLNTSMIPRNVELALSKGVPQAGLASRQAARESFGLAPNVKGTTSLKDLNRTMRGAVTNDARSSYIDRLFGGYAY